MVRAALVLLAVLVLLLVSCRSSSTPGKDSQIVSDGRPLSGDGRKSGEGGQGADAKPCQKSGPEICDGVDNDCNGRADETFELLCSACPTGGKGCVEAKLTGGGFWFGIARNLVVGNDQGIALPPLPKPQPYIYVANSQDDTVSKIRTADAVEVGRFLVGPNPSRTAVDGNGHAWVAMRGDIGDTGFGPKENVVKIDRDCIPKTKPPAATRECILLDIPDVGNLLRGVAIDARNDVWVGAYVTQEVILLDGDTGAVKDQISVPGRPYGLAIDPDGFIWISAHTTGYNSGVVIRVDPVARKADIFKTGADIDNHATYGLAADGEGGIWYASFGVDVFRIDAATGAFGPAWNTGGTTRGMAVDDKGYLWTADSGGAQLIRIDRKTGELFKVTVGTGPVGVAVDHDGNIWSVNMSSNDATKISPDGKVLATVKTGNSPYTYSDMTGAAYRIFKKMKGTFTAAYETGAAGAKWKTLSYVGNVPPPSTISIRVRAADKDTSAAAWQDVALTGKTATLSVVGSKLEIEIKLATEDRQALPNVESLSFTFEK